MADVQEMQEMNPPEVAEGGARRRVSPPSSGTVRMMGNTQKGRKRFMLLLFLCVIFICVFCLATFLAVVYLISISSGADPLRHKEDVKKPNIIFLVADDLGYNDIGYTNPAVLTPNINSLAHSGRILTGHYMVPVCTPSRHSLMTGIYAYRAKMQHFVLANDSPHCSPTDLEFLPQKMKKAGYSSHIMGKWHLGFCQWGCTPPERGFDSWYGLYSGEGDQVSHDSIPPDVIYYDMRKDRKIEFSANGTHTTDLFTNRAIELLKGDRSDPLFLLVTYTVPHHPLQAPQEYIDLYPNENDPQRKIVLGMMSQLDDNVGRIVDTLKDEGIYDDTLIIFASDNGGDIPYKHDNSPYRGGKASLFEAGSHTVSFVHGSMLTNVPESNNGMFHVLDWHTTILGIAGGDTAGGDGIDQSDLILHGGPTKRDQFIYNIDMVQPEYFGQSAIRMGDWKLIWGFNGYADGYGLDALPCWNVPANLVQLGLDGDDQTDDPDEQMRRWVELTDINRFDPNDITSGTALLFNIADDPTERTDLSGDPDQEGRVLLMKKEILNHLKGYVAPPNVSLEHWTKQAENSMVAGAWTPGWCNELDLSI